MEPAGTLQARIEVKVVEAPFEPLQELAGWERRRAGESPTGSNAPADSDALPAECHFIGRVRPFTASGAPLDALELEHYPAPP